MPIVCHHCEHQDVWVEAGIERQVRVATGYKNGTDVASIVTSPPHGETGVFRDYAITNVYNLRDEDDEIIGTCSSVSTVTHNGGDIVDSLPVAVIDSVDGCEGNPAKAELKESFLATSGFAITDASLEDWIRDQMDGQEWVAIDAAPVAALPGSGVLLSGSASDGSALSGTGTAQRFRLGFAFDVMDGSSAEPVLSCQGESPDPDEPGPPKLVAFFETDAGGASSAECYYYPPIRRLREEEWRYLAVDLGSLDSASLTAEQRYNLQGICFLDTP